MPPVLHPNRATDDGPSPADALQDRTILLVEDDEASSYAVARILGTAGYEVVPVPDYREALKVLDSRDRIDLMLTDVLLTAGTPHGFALGRMARMRRPDLRILYLTGVTDLPENEVSTALGPILRKPIEPTRLLLEISRALAAA